ncbi:MAG: DedA family protein [Clostridiales bacterium]|nr:DedA family protein [Clostridiales bacterium]
MSFLTELIIKYGVLAMFLIIMMEYACFPVSSEIVLPLSGAVASINNTHFLVILPLSILAGMIGTGICYTVGWFGGGAIIGAIKKKFPKSEKSLDASYERFHNNGASAVCIGRLIPLIRTYIALIAGAARLKPSIYFPYSFLGITIWNTLLIGLGYSLRENYGKVAIYYERYKHNLIPIFLVLLAFLITRYFYNKQKNKHQAM